MTAPTLVAAVLFAAPTAASTEIRGSIEASLIRVTGEHGPALAAQVARLIRWRGDVVRDVHPKDKLSVLWSLDEQGEPQLAAMRYAGSTIRLEAHRFDDRRGIPRYYDPDGLLIEPMLQNHPVPNYVQITEDVQRGPGLRFHNGLDLKANIGTPVYLPYDATVYRVNWQTRVNGNCIEVRYNQTGVVARFLHLDSVADSVKPGQTLEAGTELGTVGNTGRSSAPHLHYELRTSSGTVLRPVEVHGTIEALVSSERSDRFRAVVQRNRVALGSPKARTL